MEGKKKKEMSVTLRVILCSIILVVFGLFAFIFYFFMVFVFPQKVWISSLVFFPALVILFIAAFIGNKKVRKGLLFTSLSIGIVATICISIFGGIDLYYINSRLVDNSNINTDEYLPFDSKSKIARLDHEASLRFSPLANLPRIDGAAAMFPLYSSFVNATYPSNIPPLNSENGVFYYTNTYESIQKMFVQERDIVFGVDPANYRAPNNGDPNLFKDVVGRECFVFFTHKDTPVDSLTIEQLRKIYNGTYTNWKDVGGPNMKIRIYHRNFSSGSYQGLRAFMGNERICEPESPDYVVGLMSGMIKVVADYINNPGAIGYSYHVYSSQIMKGNDIKLLKVNDVAPNLETISNRTYPIVDDFYMYGHMSCYKETTAQLREWVKSSEGQELVYKSGYAKAY